MTTKQNAFTVNDKDIGQINQLTRRHFTYEELYLFPIVLCDNDIDRDFERFTGETLEKLATLFVGKTGIFDHNPTGHNQTARIYHCEVKTDPTRQTADGQNYSCLYAKAYIVKTQGSEDLIKEIDGGIKKEVSVSCTVAQKICSICGADHHTKICEHKPGQSYKVGNGRKQCFLALSGPTDAYEFSFVAVPAQRRAGVVKQYGLNFLKEERPIAKELLKQMTPKSTLSENQIDAIKAYITDLEKRAVIGDKHLEDKRKEVARGLLKTGIHTSNESLGQLVEKLDLSDLEVLKKLADLSENQTLSEHPQAQSHNVFKI